MHRYTGRLRRLEQAAHAPAAGAVREALQAGLRDRWPTDPRLRTLVAGWRRLVLVGWLIELAGDAATAAAMVPFIASGAELEQALVAYREHLAVLAATDTGW